MSSINNSSRIAKLLSIPVENVNRAARTATELRLCSGLTVAAAVVTVAVTVAVIVSLAMLTAAAPFVLAIIGLLGFTVMFGFLTVVGPDRCEVRIAKMRQKVNAFVAEKCGTNSTLGSSRIVIGGHNDMHSEIVERCDQFIDEKYGAEHEQFIAIMTKLEASKTNTGNPEELRNQKREMSTFLETYPRLGGFFLQVETFKSLKIEETTSKREVIMQAVMLLELNNLINPGDTEIKNDLIAFLEGMGVSYDELKNTKAPMEWNLLSPKKQLPPRKVERDSRLESLS